MGGAGTDDAALEQAVDAANDWCFEERSRAGYIDEAVQPPDEACRLASTLMAKRLYLMGPNGAAETFDEFSGTSGPSIPSLAEVRRLLRSRRPSAV